VIPRDAAIRRDLFRLAMTAGTALLVASQLACRQPQSIPSSIEPPPSAQSGDRWPLTTQTTLKANWPSAIILATWWVRPPRPAKAEAPTAPKSAESKPPVSPRPV